MASEGEAFKNASLMEKTKMYFYVDMVPTHFKTVYMWVNRMKGAFGTCLLEN